METYYNKKTDGINSRIKNLKKKSNIFLCLKILTFVCFAFTAWAWIMDDDSPALSIISFVLYLITYISDKHIQEKIGLLKTKSAVFYKELECIRGNFHVFDCGSNYIDNHHEYAFDLDIFGKDSLFNRISRCISGIGSHCLAEKFKSPCLNKSTISKRQEAVRELVSKINWCWDFIARDYIDSKITERLKYICDTENDESDIKLFCTWKFHLIWTAPVAIFMFLLIGNMLGYVDDVILGTMFIFNLTYVNIFGKTRKRIFKEACAMRKEFGAYKEILKHIEKESFNSELLKKQYNDLFNDTSNSLCALKKVYKILTNIELRDNMVMNIVSEGLYLSDILMIRLYLKWKQSHIISLPVWIKAISEFDSLVSMGIYTFNHSDNTFPTFADDDVIIDAKSVYHPFLDKRNAVGNDFHQKQKDIFIITGANMAGKSTMLRTIGINMVMAGCGMPTCADYFAYTPCHLFSNMRTSDDLSKNISYFNAELIRLNQLIQFCKTHEHTYIILDEILKGTNSEDKLKGSRLFLEYISQLNVTGIIATHDLALSEMENEGKQYSNYCFEIEMSENINYSYKITQGVARNMNATYLLNKILKQK